MKFSGSNFVLDPCYPALEFSPREYSNALFSRRFGVPCGEGDKLAARMFSNMEMIRCYSIPDSAPDTPLNSNYYTAWLDNYLQCCIPVKSLSIIITHLIDVVGFNKDLVYGTDYAASHQIYSISSPPSTLGWSSAYAKDPRTKIILPILQANERPKWWEAQLATIEVDYRTHLTFNHIGILHRKFVFL